MVSSSPRDFRASSLAPRVNQEYLWHNSQILTRLTSSLLHRRSQFCWKDPMRLMKPQMNRVIHSTWCCRVHRAPVIRWCQHTWAFYEAG